MNLDNLTYRQKVIGLITGFLILCLLMYFMAIKKSVVAYVQMIENHEVLRASQNAPQEIAEYNARLKGINRSLKSFEASSRNDHQHLLAYVSEFCAHQKIRLEYYPSIENREKEGLVIHTHKIEVQGEFQRLLSLMYALEQKDKYGRVSSAVFEMKKNRETRKNQLHLLIYLQTISFNSTQI